MAAAPKLPASVVAFPTAIACPFPVESQVALKGGSVVMTVVAAFPPAKTGEPWFVTAAWHDDVGSPQECSYPVTALYDAQEYEKLAVAKPQRKSSRRNVSRWAKKRSAAK